MAQLHLDLVRLLAASQVLQSGVGQAQWGQRALALGAELARIDGNEMRPAMPVAACLGIEDRTPLSYLTKPLTDYFERAMRES